MFKILKDKIKSAISKISEGVEKEGKVEEKEVEKPIEDSKEIPEPENRKKSFFASLKEKIVGKEEKPIAEGKVAEKIHFKEEVENLAEHKKEHIKEINGIKKETEPVRVEHKKEEKHKTEGHKEIKNEEKQEIKKPENKE